MVNFVDFERAFQMMCLHFIVQNTLIIYIYLIYTSSPPLPSPPLPSPPPPAHMHWNAGFCELGWQQRGSIGRGHFKG